jgi:hypothetical protein
MCYFVNFSQILEETILHYLSTYYQYLAKEKSDERSYKKKYI